MRTSDWRETDRVWRDKQILRELVNTKDKVGGMRFSETRKLVTLSTSGATTSVGLTPAGVIMHAAIRVSTAIARLDSADPHVQLGISGTTDKYIDKANGSSATSIAANIKDVYKFNPSTGIETAALILTITAGSDQTPSAGIVEFEVIHLDHSNLTDR